MVNGVIEPIAQCFFNDAKIAANPTFQPTLDAAHFKLAQIDALLKEIQAAVVIMHTNIGDSLIAITKVADEVRNLEAIGSCDFLTRRYNTLVADVCDGSVTAVSTLSFFGFAIGVCAIPMLITSILISNRVFHYEELPMANAFSRHDNGIQLKVDDNSVGDPAESERALSIS